jgi:FKBP-type peptidyl-prolyl cis-trans isomerase FkpA
MMPHTMHDGRRMRRRPQPYSLRRSAALLAGLVFATACGDANPLPDDQSMPAQQNVDLTQVSQTYAPEFDIDLTQMTRAESGLYTQDLVEGDGPVAEPGSAIVVHYTGWLPDGRQFDSSRLGQPYELVIGVGGVIDGWDQGIPGMRAGGTRRLVIPPSMAYGAFGDGSGVIPPAATLIFDVELLEVRQRVQ